MSSLVPLEKFIEAYTESHGPEGAALLLEETLHRLGLEDKVHFSHLEAILICKDLQSKSGFVGIVAGILLKNFISKSNS